MGKYDDEIDRDDYDCDDDYNYGYGDDIEDLSTSYLMGERSGTDVVNSLILGAGKTVFDHFVKAKKGEEDRKTIVTKGEEKRKEIVTQGVVDAIKDTIITDNDISEHSAKTDDAIREYSAKTDDDIRKASAATKDQIDLLEAQARIEREKREFEEITLLKKKIEAGLIAPPTPAAAVAAVPTSQEGLTMETILNAMVESLLVSPDELEQLTADDLLKGDAPYVMQNVIQRGINLILAEKKSGKSILAMQLAIALAKGQRVKIFPDAGEVVKQHVIHYDTENGRDTLAVYFRGVLPDMVSNGSIEIRMGVPQLETLLRDMAMEVAKNGIINRRYPNLTFVVDCMYLYKVDTEEIIRKFMALCHNARERGCTVTILVVNHLNLNGTTAGSQDLTRATRMTIELKHYQEKKKGSKKKPQRRDMSDPLEKVTISWWGRSPHTGKRICNLNGEIEGFPGNTHFVPVPLKLKEVKEKQPVLYEEVVGLALTVYDSVEGTPNHKAEEAAKVVAEAKGVEVSRQNVQSWVDNKDVAGVEDNSD